MMGKGHAADHRAALLLVPGIINAGHGVAQGISAWSYQEAVGEQKARVILMI